MATEVELAKQIKQWAHEMGFIACGITSADPIDAKDQDLLTQWLGLNYHGEMRYLENNQEKRVHPAALVPGAKSVICLAYNYFPPDSNSQSNIKIARYAWGEDYHRVVKDKVHELMLRIASAVPEFSGRGFTDSAPIMERQLAERAGLGWIGKNSLLLRKGTGSYFFLAEIISNLTVELDLPNTTNHCGTCTACIDACPTQAIVHPQVIDSNLCISYQTIEKKDSSTLPLEQQQGWIYGCDICQEVCPWNRFSEPHNEPRFNPLPYAQASESHWKAWVDDPESFKPLLKSTAAERTGHRKILSEAARVFNHSNPTRDY